MISRRAKRSATPQETLKQFALNTSKGVDSTKSPTDSETVVRLTNLTVNLDGSVSPRKPIKQINEFQGSDFVEYLYDGHTVLRIGPTAQPNSGGKGLRLYSDNKPLTFTLKYTDYYGNLNTIEEVDAIPTKYVRYLAETHGIQVINLNTASAIGNMAISVDEWLLTSNFISEDDRLHLNPLLYDDDTFSEHFSPRYLSVQFSNGVWVVEIKSPEVNEITPTDSGGSFTPNTTLDNPYAVRDYYNSPAFAVKGILPYAYSEKTALGTIPASASVSNETTFASFSLPPKLNEVLEPNLVTNDPGQIDYNDTAVISFSNMFGAYVEVSTKLSSLESGDDYDADIITLQDVDGAYRNNCQIRAYRTVTLTVRTSVHVPAQAELTDKKYTFEVDKIHMDILTNGIFQNDRDMASNFDTKFTTSLKYTAEDNRLSCSSPTLTRVYHGEIDNVSFKTAQVMPNPTYKYTYDEDSLTAELKVTFTHTPDDVEDPFKDYMFLCSKFGLGSSSLSVAIDGSISCEYPTVVMPDTVAELTESTKTLAYRPCTTSSVDAPATILKAMCNMHSTSKEDLVYASWVRSTDGYNWDDAVLKAPNTLDVRDATVFFGNNSDNSDSSDTVGSGYTTRRFIKVNASSENDKITETLEGQVYNLRPDILYLGEQGGYNGVPAQYMFRICVLKKITADDKDPAYDASIVDEYGEPVTTQYKVALECGRAISIPQYGPNAIFADYTYGNTVAGAKLYHKKAIYSYGYSKFFNNIFVSGIDSFITPLYNIIDADVSEAKTVNCLVPWRDYLISATENAMFLHSKTELGYTSKPISTSVGISQPYSKCCKAALNGIVFMSENAVYFMYPNVYSGNDDILNLTCISTPVENYLYEYDVLDGYSRFAFITTTEYVLMIPYEHSKLGRRTLCLRYDLTDRVWRVSEYPLPFYTYKQFGFDDVRLYCADPNSVGDDGLGSVREFQFDYDVRSDEGKLGAYGDFISGSTVPIEFEWDTGQKTDSIAQTKQFVESKLMFATDDALETFPMELTIAIDGDPHIIHKDINTDSPFWNSDDLETKGTLGTSFRLGNEELGYSDKGILRQLVVRYSGKGRSVRHILKGRTRSKFKLYETYVRYKTLNVKR